MPAHPSELAPVPGPRRGGARAGAVLGLATLLAGGCRERSGRDDPTGEVSFVRRELEELEAGLAARDETKVAIGCLSTTPGLARLPATMKARIEQICHVEAPRLYLTSAVASVKQGMATASGDPDLAAIACMQLLVEDAMTTIAAHPSGDASLQALADEYARLCPAEAAKIRAKLAPR